MLKRTWTSLLPFVILLAAMIGFHWALRVMEKEFCLTQLTMSLYYSIVVMGLCLVMGYAGQVSLGHAAFFAIGGYSSAILTTHNLVGLRDTAWAERLISLRILAQREDLYGYSLLTVTPWVAFFVAMLATAAIALLIGYPSLRLKGHYLAMATLGFGLIVYKIILGSELAGTTDGISSVPEWTLGGGLTITGKSALRVQNYYIACGMVLLTLLLLRNLLHSRVGRALQAIHDRETAANAMGINTASYKLRAFVLSALLAAAAGVLFTHYHGGIGPSEAGVMKSVRYLSLAAAGGMANIWGVTIVSTALNYMSLRGMFGSLDHAVFGVILIIIISIAPEGPLKPLGMWLRRWPGRWIASWRGSHGTAA
jgi:branched-chain amino acid transport system permease protein